MGRVACRWRRTNKTKQNKLNLEKHINKKTKIQKQKEKKQKLIEEEKTNKQTEENKQTKQKEMRVQHGSVTGSCSMKL